MSNEGGHGGRFGHGPEVVGERMVNGLAGGTFAVLALALAAGAAILIRDSAAERRAFRQAAHDAEAARQKRVAEESSVFIPPPGSTEKPHVPVRLAMQLLASDSGKLSETPPLAEGALEAACALHPKGATVWASHCAGCHGGGPAFAYRRATLSERHDARLVPPLVTAFRAGSLRDIASFERAALRASAYGSAVKPPGPALDQATLADLYAFTMAIGNANVKANGDASSKTRTSGTVARVPATGREGR